MEYKDVIEKVFNDDFDKVNSYRYQDIINYLNTVNDSFTLETYFISMDDVLNKLNNNDIKMIRNIKNNSKDKNNVRERDEK